MFTPTFPFNSFTLYQVGIKATVHGTVDRPGHWRLGVSNADQLLIDNTKSMVTCLHLKLDDILKAKGCNRIVPSTTQSVITVFFVFELFQCVYFSA